MPSLHSTFLKYKEYFLPIQEPTFTEPFGTGPLRLGPPGVAQDWVHLPARIANHIMIGVFVKRLTLMQTSSDHCPYYRECQMQRGLKENKWEFYRKQVNPPLYGRTVISLPHARFVPLSQMMMTSVLPYQRTLPCFLDTAFEGVPFFASLFRDCLGTF